MQDHQDHPHTGHAGYSSRIPNVKAEDSTYELFRPGVWKEISGGDAMFHQTPRVEWEVGLAFKAIWKAIWTLRIDLGSSLPHR